MKEAMHHNQTNPKLSLPQNEPKQVSNRETLLLECIVAAFTIIGTIAQLIDVSLQITEYMHQIKLDSLRSEVVQPETQLKSCDSRNTDSRTNLN
jgi:hypothetical protein